MADQEPETQSSALGKRARDGEADEDSNMEPPAKVTDNGNGAAVEEDSDDDDVGPMPMPDNEAAAGGVKKKRKGAFCQ